MSTGTYLQYWWVWSSYAARLVPWMWAGDWWIALSSLSGKHTSLWDGPGGKQVWQPEEKYEMNRTDIRKAQWWQKIVHYSNLVPRALSPGLADGKNPGDEVDTIRIKKYIERKHFSRIKLLVLQVRVFFSYSKELSRKKMAFIKVEIRFTALWNSF